MRQFQNPVPRFWIPIQGEEVLVEHWLPEIRPKYSKGVVKMLLPPDLYRVELITVTIPEVDTLDFLLHQLRPTPDKLCYLQWLEKQEEERLEKIREQMCSPSTF